MESLVVGVVVVCTLGIVALVIFGLAALVAWGAQTVRQRRERLSAWATTNGWTFAFRPAVTWVGRLPGRTGAEIAFALSTTIDGRPVTVAEYQYTERTTSTTTDAEGRSSSSSSTTTHRLVVTVVRLHRRLPSTSVHSRGPHSRVTKAGPSPGETSSGHPDFDHAFRIRTERPDLVAWWCTPALRAAHLRGSVPVWSIHGDELLTYRHGQLKTPEEIPEQVRPVIALATLLGG